MSESEITEEAGGQTDTNTAAEQEAEGAANESKDAEATENQEGAEAEKPAPEVPDSYEFELPEGVELDASLAEAATPVFKELGLSNEQASQLVQLYMDNQAAQAEASQKALGDQIEQWQNDLKADQDFGGDNYEENVAKVTEFFANTAPEGSQDALKQLFDSTGLGSHPEFVKYMLNLSTLIPTGEDQPAGGSPLAMDSASMASRWYTPEGGAKSG